MRVQEEMAMHAKTIIRVDGVENPELQTDLAICLLKKKT